MTTTGTEKSIPFLDLSGQHKEIEAELTDAVGDVFSRGSFILGEEVSAFESEWADYCEAEACAGVGNGTDAIALALLASNTIVPGRGDEVITTAISAGYTALAILQAGAIPVFADVDPGTLLIDPRSVEQLITSRTKAIVPVHLYGQICDIGELASLSVRHNLALIEDAAQAHGAWRCDGSANGFHRTAAFSFYPTKNLGACGDAGAVVSDDPELVGRVKMLRQGGHPSALLQRIPGRNSRLDEMQAAILRVKLRRLDAWNERRSRLADMYDEMLDGVARVERRAANRHANHLYVIRNNFRDELRSFLSARRIGTLIHYSPPLHREPLFFDEPNPPRELTCAEAAAAQVVSLPMNSHSEEWEIEAVAEAVIAFTRR